MKYSLLGALAVLGFCCTAADPLMIWDFEQADAKTGTSYSQNRQLRLYGIRQAKKGGINGTNGAICDDKKSPSVAHLKKWADWNAFTFELKFKLDASVDSKRGNALLCFGKHSWNRGQFLLWVTQRGELEGKFRLVGRGKNEKNRHIEVKATSKPLNFTPGQWNIVRVASASGGAMKIWLNGVLVAVKGNDAWGFNDLKCDIPREYPVLTIGRDQADPTKIFRPMKGIVDDIKIWNTFETPDLQDIVSATSVAENENYVLIPASGKGRTGKFTVYDRPGKLLGSWVRPEQKFLDAAAYAELQLTANDLIVTLHNPIAEDTSVARNSKSVFEGDHVEFFFRPDTGKSIYYHYALNANGKSASYHWQAPGTQNKDFRSSAGFESKITPREWIAVIRIPREEIALKSVEPGKIASLNFTRSGPTGGGQSSWSPVGQNFHTIERFNSIVFDSLKEALRKELSAKRSEFEKIGRIDITRKREVAAEIERLAVMIEKNGDDAKSFNGLRRAIDGLQLRFTALHFANTPALLWTPQDPWRNDIQVSMLSQKTEKITVILPQNSYTYKSLFFSNLTDKPYLGQIKCFPPVRKEKQQIYNHFNSSIWDVSGDCILPIYRNVKFFEALPLEAVSGGLIYDPLIPLPMNTLVRAAAKESKQLWIRISSKGMQPGIHHYVMVLKPAYTGFMPQEIELEINIRPVNLEGIHLDSGHYTYLRQPGHWRFLAQKDTTIVYAGTPGQVTCDIYPQVDKDGNVIKFSDYAQIDRKIDALIAGGIAKERIKVWFYNTMKGYGMRLNGKPQKLKYNTPEFKKALKAFLADLTGHLEKKYGITKERIIFYPVDEPSGDINDPKSTMFSAYQEGKMIKEADKNYRILVNPHPKLFAQFVKNKETINKLCEVFDIIELYRPALTPASIEWAQKSGKEIWTYGIYMNTTLPDIYRREYWESLRDNFTEIITYWHLDSHAGGDGFNSQDGLKNRADYGSIYADHDMETILTSRRQEAHDLGREDFRIAEYCRRLLKQRNEPQLNQKFNAIIQKGASSDFNGMEDARLELLRFAEDLTPRTN